MVRDSTGILHLIWHTDDGSLFLAEQTAFACVRTDRASSTRRCGTASISAGRQPKSVSLASHHLIPPKLSPRYLLIASRLSASSHCRIIGLDNHNRKKNDSEFISKPDFIPCYFHHRGYARSLPHLAGISPDSTHSPAGAVRYGMLWRGYLTAPTIQHPPG